MDPESCGATPSTKHAGRELPDSRLPSAEEPAEVAKTLFEAYAVLTRLLAPWRLRADVAERLLHDTLKEHAAVASLPDEDAAWSIVRDLARRGLTGGIAHDAHVTACAQAAGASALATLNGRDFARLDLGATALVVP